jgi:molybdopterin synthase sulfur carrier subunit
VRLTVKYFAWLRERVGRAEEAIEAPASVRTVADLVAHLKGLGEEYEHAFAESSIVRAAVDKRHAPPETPLAGAREVAFFPPMTGG